MLIFVPVLSLTCQRSLVFENIYTLNVKHLLNIILFISLDYWTTLNV